MSLSVWIGWGLALVLFAASLWFRRQRRSQNPFTTRSGVTVEPPKMAAMPNAGEVLVYMNEDGSVRELTEAEKKYVETEFSPLDGARPFIKSHYSQCTASGEIRGYLPRAEVPDGMPLGPAPPRGATQQQTPLTVAESISELIRRQTRN